MPSSSAALAEQTKVEVTKTPVLGKIKGEVTKNGALDLMETVVESVAVPPFASVAVTRH